MSSSPNLRQTRDGLLDNLCAAVTGAVTGVMHGEKPTPCCISCVSFRESDEVCLMYKRRPPARVIAYGCPAYTDNLDVPF